jgi:hypothetical protein
MCSAKYGVNIMTPGRLSIRALAGILAVLVIGCSSDSGDEHDLIGCLMADHTLGRAFPGTMNESISEQHCSDYKSRASGRSVGTL